MKFLDLFAGIGGFRLGLESAGHECVGFCEIDKFARKSYKAIHDTKGEIELHDITAVTNEEWGKFRGTVDIICGGFPCQAFSVAGKRKGFLDETRGTLFFEIARAAKEIKPPLLFLENVKGLLSHDKGRTFRTILSTLDELGYDAEWQILNSKDYGVPQNRERVFIIGHLRGECRRQVFPIFGKNGTTNQASIKQIGNISNSTSFGGNPQTGRVYDIDGISPTLNTMQGGGREPKVMVIDDQGRKHKKITPKQVVPTLRAQFGGNPPKVVMLDKPVKIRKLTPRECWRLQGFPDFAFDKAQEVNSNSQLYKQAGNSVTVNVIKAIAERFGK